MIYRIFGGLGLLCLGLTFFGVAVPAILTGLFLVVGGVALLAGL